MVLSQENMYQTAVARKIVYQCTNADIRGGGGLETYVASLVNSQTFGVADFPLTSLKNFDRSSVKLLHIHDPDMLMDFQEDCPAVLTLHNHFNYCPSGTKYLADRQRECDRNLHPLGCTWGHLVDGCGSRRPPIIMESWQNSYNALTTLQKLKIPVIAISNYVREQIISSGISPARVITLHCGVKESNSLAAPLTKEIHQQQRILFVGRIVPYKGIEWLIKALAKTDQRIHLDIAGDGWGKPSMEHLAKQMGLSDRITWHGWCQGEKLEALYRQCFSVIFPSLWPEPAGLVTLEAYARYRPVIASAVGGIPEYLQDGKTGILITPNHVQKLADAINKLAASYDKSRFMGEKGHALFQSRFTIDIHIKRLEKIYEQTIADFISRKNK